MITSITITIVTGILSGFAASIRTPSDGLEDLIRSTIVGMLGSFVGLKVAGGIFGSVETGAPAATLAISAMTGATLLLLVVNKFRRVWPVSRKSR
jgi:uncharacterized membrane protein YeaQ/YmgE (transglycosylase-associated protein family)